MRKLFFIKDATQYVFACKYTREAAEEWVRTQGSKYIHKGDYKINEGHSKIQ